ncbi:toxin Doc [Streptomyces beihaiensis]|uniref:Toxin Doc n=1 Tax=Streptomyces beihaiensis TaxID=2984495 RepID=A0ABT3TQN7_9ACTN|nr:toxin Doc [Streptomyces beihaiensis]MCX3058363.1 toxin Doc [Streptomyces beihaiensis]
MELNVDVGWLLDVQDSALPESPEVRDYSALAAACSRQRVNTPRLGEEADEAWGAAALLHTTVALKPLPADNTVFGCALAVQYMRQAGAGVDPPYGALVELVKGLRDGSLDVFDAADRLRSWRI